jgi:hypothetical protein
MTQYEFLGYKATPTDLYMLGVASVRLYGKVVLRYKHVKTKDGTGDFFTSPSYSVAEDGEKKYMQAFMLDSRSDEESLMDFVRKHAKAAIANSRNPMPTQEAIFSQPEAVQQDLPF